MKIAIIIITVLLLFISIDSFGQAPVMTNPIPLSFGTVAVNGTGYIRMDLDGNRYTNSGSGITALTWPGHPDASCAKIEIKIIKRTRFYSFSLPTSINLSGPNGTLTVQTITHSTYPTGNQNAGTYSFDVGGTINNLTVNTSAGTYTGYFTVGLNHN